MSAIGNIDHATDEVAIPCLWQGDGFLIDGPACRETGAALAERYRTNRPFPHIVIDNFIDPRVLDRVLMEFGAHRSHASHSFNREQERLKTQMSPADSRSLFVRNFFAELNSANFLAFLEDMTGIAGLLPDPHFLGGGFHEITRGGKLDVHSDFNIHKRLNLERRLNLLIYLNKDWEPDFGGNLELWNASMTTREVNVAPLFNRAVIFNTDLDSLHGHPDPLNCPEDDSRKSVALYYYTSPERGVAGLAERTTIFRVRPGTTDKPDWLVRRRHILSDWLPPVLYRLWQRAERKLRRMNNRTKRP
jgi:Rps23 Pro-64 3,4-dihydroxylase Tpa1-like proline 4-hydroxylase